MEHWGMILSSTNKELDVVTYIREHLPKNEELDLGALLQDVQKRESIPSDVREGDSYFEMMTVAEIVMGCLHDDLRGLDDEKKGWDNIKNPNPSPPSQPGKRMFCGCVIIFAIRYIMPGNMF